MGAFLFILGFFGFFFFMVITGGPQGRWIADFEETLRKNEEI